jgi:hypothetical protein
MRVKRRSSSIEGGEIQDEEGSSDDEDGRREQRE